MRVAFFSHSAGLYGAERSLLDLVLGVRMYGVQPVVVLPKYGPLVNELEGNDINYIVHPYYGWLGRKYKFVKGIYRFLANRVSAQRLARILREVKIDLVYSNTISIPVGAIVAKAIGVKHIWHVREFVQEDMGADFDFGTPYSTQFIANNSSCIIYNSYAVKTKFTPLLGNTPGVVIYNGWLTGEPPCGVSSKILTYEKPIKLCIVGSVHRGKGQSEAIEALSILMQNFPYITLDIVGTGDISYIRELKELCSVRRVSTRVTWSGFSSNVAEVFRQSDITLVCSRNEAFGRVVVESMAEGCPVVGSCSGGIPEIITQGKNGLMYDSGCFEDLARQVSILINDPALYSRIVREGILDVYKRFSRKNYVEQVHHILGSL